MAEQEMTAELQERINREMEIFGEMLPHTRNALLDAQTGIKGFGAATQAGGKALTDLGKAASSAAKAMYDGQKGAAAFNETVDHTADAITMLGAAVAALVGGPLGLLIAGVGMAAQAVGKYTKAANKMSDDLYKGFQGMAKTGAAASDGLKGLYNDLQKVGLGVQDLENYTRLIGESSKDLALFSGSVFQGRQRFAEMGKGLEAYRTQLYNAGLNQEEINEGAMAYLRLQTRLGRSQTQTTDQLADGAKRYLIEQDALTKLTGQSRKEMEDQAEAALMEEQYAAKIRQLELEGNKEAVENLRKMNAVYSAAGPEMGRAFRASVTGNLSNADAQKANLASNGEMLKSTREVINGNRDWKDAVTSTGRQMGKFSDTVGTTLGQHGAYNESFGNMAEQQKLRLLTEKGITEKMGEIERDQAKQGIEGGKAADELQDAQSKLRTEQVKAMHAAQDFVAAGMIPATKAMNKFAGATEAVIDKINDILGIKGTKSKAETTGAYTGAAVGALAGAAKGAAIGSVVPVIGTAVGGAVGGVLGGVAGYHAGGAVGRVAGEVTGVGQAPAGTGYGASSANIPTEPAGSESAILALIGQAESKGNYNILVGGKSEPNLTNMTVAEVLQYQSQMRAKGHESTAVGKYQIIKSTLEGLIQQGAVNVNDKFDPGTQDKLGRALLERRGYSAYKQGKMDASRFADNLAMEWASLPMSNGKSYYSGVGSNHALMSRNQVMEVLGAPKAADGGIIPAKPGGTLVHAAEAGVDEAFIPLKDGVIPVEIKNPAREKVKTPGSELASSLVGSMAIDKVLPGAGKLVSGLDTVADKELSWVEKTLDVVKMINPTVRIAAALIDTATKVNAAYTTTNKQKHEELMTRYDNVKALSGGTIDPKGNQTIIDVSTTISSTFAKELENIKVKANEIAPAEKNNDVSAALKQIGEELKRQSEASRQVMETIASSEQSTRTVELLSDLVKAQKDQNDIATKILQTSS